MSDKISIMLIAGKREQLQMAAMVASVGAVSGSDVTVFLSMNAMEYFTKGSNVTAPADGPMGALLQGTLSAGSRAGRCKNLSMLDGGRYYGVKSG